MPRGRKKKFRLRFNIKLGTAKSVVVVLLFLGWLVSFVSFFAPDYSLNSKIYHFWRIWFGGVSFFAPLLLVLIAIFLVDKIKTRFKEPRVLFGIILLYTAVVGIAHIFIPADRAFDVALEGEGGGMAGFYIASNLSSALSRYGAIAVLFGVSLIAIIILFNVSLDQFVEKTEVVLSKFNIFKKFKFSLPKRQENYDDEDDEIEVTSGISVEEDDEEQTHPYDRVQPTHTPVQEEFAFEVVPSMSEPQSDTLLNDGSAVNTLISEAKPSALPYVDAIWKNPPLDLLLDYDEKNKADIGNIEERKKKIKETLKSFDIEVEVTEVKSGPSVTQYQLKAESGVKVSRIANLQNDIAMVLESPTGSVRIEAPIPGKSLIGIEVPNNTRAMVSFKSLLMSEPMKELKSKIGIVLGKDVAGKVYAYDIGKMPHMLIAGTTGSGKSIFVHNVLFSILFRANPNEVKFILVDPKRVELIHYQDIPHLYTPVVTDMNKVPSVFAWAVTEMERRYVLFEKARVRNIEGYNKESGFQALPYIMIVVEELGELMQIDPNGVEKSIIRLAQLARATGIHLILTVQRPDTKVITGLIKANIPTRVAFNVNSQIDSRVIIDQPGAEKLLGKGDMLFIPPDMSRPIRLQGAFVSEKEVANLVDYLKSRGVAPDYREEIFQVQSRAQNANTVYGNDVDELFDRAVEIINMAGKASASLLQRKLSIGYARAARIIDELEQNNIIGPADGQKPRDVLSGFGPKLPPRHLPNAVDQLGSEVDSIQV